MRVQKDRVLLKSGTKLFKTRHPASIAAATEAVRKVIPEQQRRRKQESKFEQGTLHLEIQSADLNSKVNIVRGSGFRHSLRRRGRGPLPVARESSSEGIEGGFNGDGAGGDSRNEAVDRSSNDEDEDEEEGEGGLFMTEIYRTGMQHIPQPFCGIYISPGECLKHPLGFDRPPVASSGKHVRSSANPARTRTVSNTLYPQ